MQHFQYVSGPRSEDRILFEHFTEDAFRLGIVALGQGWRSVLLYVVDYFGSVVVRFRIAEDLLKRAHFINAESQSPHVCLITQSCLDKCLWRHVWKIFLDRRDIFRMSLCKQCAQAPIIYLDDAALAALLDHYVSGVNTAVDDPEVFSLYQHAAAGVHE